MTRAVLSIGSNLGDRADRLAGAIDAVRPWLLAVSPVYETPPWGPVVQDDFLNAVLLVDDDDASPRDWLVRGQAAEQAAARIRTVRWGPRSLDVDVITVIGRDGTIVSADPHLRLPHPRAHERAFVLIPWRAIEPTAQLAGRPLDAWLDALPDADRAGVRRVDLVLQ